LKKVVNLKVERLVTCELLVMSRAEKVEMGRRLGELQPSKLTKFSGFSRFGCGFSGFDLVLD
jgi:hypothetical protein